jgi:hypothetical protein
MVQGLERYKQHFKEKTDQYVMIGGTACEVLLAELAIPFRATKDLDIVLIVDALDAAFLILFWEFIADGGYQNKEKSSGVEQFYRFYNPTQVGYPQMIELFSAKPNNISHRFDTHLTPIHIESSIESLSAILLNDDYYHLLLESRKIVDDLSVLDIEAMILFKMKAWIDVMFN